MRKSAFLLFLLGLQSLICQADDWPWPKVSQVFSTDSIWKVVVIPTDHKEPRKGPSNSILFKKVAGNFKQVCRYSNEFKISPVNAYAFVNGSVAYLDHWHEMGYGKNVISVFDSLGKRISAYELSQVLDATEIHRVPISISSIGWRDSVYHATDGTSILVRTNFRGSNGSKSGRVGKRNEIDSNLEAITEIKMDGTIARRK